MSDTQAMRQTMPLPALVAELARRCDISESTAESFVSALTDTVISALRTDRNVRIKGIGLFAADGSGNVAFEPDKVIAEEINAPFSIFEPVEIDGTELPTDGGEDAVDGGGAVVDEPSPAGAEPAIQPAAKPVPEPIAEQVTEPTVEQAPDCAETRQEHEPGTEPEAAHAAYPTEPEPEPETVSEYRDEEPPVTGETRVIKVVVREHPWLTGILAGVAGLLIGLACGYFLYPRLNLSGVRSVELSAGYVNVTQDGALRESTSVTAGTSDSMFQHPVQTPQTADSAAVAGQEPGQPAEAPATKPETVYDTIRGNRYLTTMARQHYGRKIFWVYIYEENKAIISDPDNIAPNTVVVIPPAEKYGIKAGDRISEQAAERKAVEIIGNNS